MRNSVKRATADILSLLADRFQEELNDDEQDFFENEVYQILEEFFPDTSVSTPQQTSIPFERGFSVNLNSTSTAVNSTTKENTSVGYKEKDRNATNVSRSKGRSNYTPRWGSDVRDKDK
jgi:hypothetical protein